MAAPPLTPEEWVAAVRAAAPAPAPPAPPGSRLADLLKVSNEVLFPSGSGKDGQGQLITTNAETVISSFRPFLQTVTLALRSHHWSANQKCKRACSRAREHTEWRPW